MIKVKLIHSRIGCNPAQRKVLDALGLRHTYMEKTFKDNPAVRGMLNKVKHLVEVIN
ncbi:50S ribosomal protein L30 [Desulfovibrio litoralis]|uniref:50S ribosomal protein L30 n=1 Tax=Desulfovibrio litoralis DSM 11393 TaxID=1121455 RepID=A0A1M7SDU2_9BACT|nr:50S ribosomal protein L30 [Desulfovibrio litoralis]SHN56649.1 LSU ribosomal protein L30P [Desulfovibrio litoralis DSM 11393]